MKKSRIGSSEKITILGREGVPAKVDTGADSSAVWASHIRVDREGVLKFRLFGEGSKYYTGKVIKRTNFKVASIRNSSGYSEIRYRAYFTITINNRKIKALLNLSDRSHNTFPVLIGRRTVAHKFLIDVSKTRVKPPKAPKTQALNKKLTKDPYRFHKKYVKNNGRSGK